MYREELEYAQPGLCGERAAYQGLGREDAPEEYREDELRDWRDGFDRVRRLRAALARRGE